MTYKPLFDPQKPVALPDEIGRVERSADRFTGYVYDDAIKLAVNVALATMRPLLVSGPPGCGKSTLAREVARGLRGRYYEEVVTSRTRAQDLLWRFDSLRRLSDAHTGKMTDEVKDVRRYIEPGKLWWAFQPASAAKVGTASDPGEKLGDEDRTVVLVDEIDKADSEVPNDLLVPLGAWRFRVTELDLAIEAARAPLVVITTNNERDLPNAFLRRCVNLTLETPKPKRLKEIARAHFPEVGQELIGLVVARFDALRTEAEERRLRPPGTAEVLDAIRACAELGLDKAPAILAEIEEVADVTLWKHAKLEEKP